LVDKTVDVIILSQNEIQLKLFNFFKTDNYEDEDEGKGFIEFQSLSLMSNFFHKKQTSDLIT
jgi:hypothetical protein